jgi:hypothetical protein
MVGVPKMLQPHFEGSVRSPLTLPKMGVWSPPGLPNCRRQNTLHWGVLYTVGKVLKCRCPKWPRMSHLDICSPSYGQTKGRESNCQFDSRPLKVGNQPKSDVGRWSATASESSQGVLQVWFRLRPDWRSGQEVMFAQSPGNPNQDNSGLHFGNPGKKCHSDVASAGECREYYMGEGGGSPRVRAVVSQMSPRLPVACPNTKRMQNEF